MRERLQLEIVTGKGKKGRSFRADLLAWIDAPDMFENGGVGNNNRPIWITVATSEQETRAFVTNFRRGERAEKVSRHSYSRSTDRWQLVKSAGYQIHQQKRGDGVVSTFFLPELFTINPGMVDPDRIQFVMLPSTQWLESQSVSVEDAEALLFLAYLDRRTRFPFPPEVTFARGLFDRCIELGFATRTNSRHGYGYTRKRFLYTEHSLENLGMRGGVAFRANHEDFGQILAEEIKKWR